MTTLRLLLHVAAHRDYELHSLDFSTAFLQGSLHEEIWLRRPPGFTGSFPPGTQWSLRRPVYGLRQAPPLADPTTGPVTARHTTTLPCPAAPSGSLTGFHVPSFSRNLVGVRPLMSQHVGVWFEPSGETAVCVDGDSYQPLATFTAEPGSGLYTLHTGPRAPQQQPHQQQQPQLT
ncbi:unnamed protein product [Closterium sp. NIES-53]